MPCDKFSVLDKDGQTVGVGFICSRGRRRKDCRFCGRPSTKLCDRPLEGKKAGKTCDAPMCDRCAVSIGPEKDLCPPHARERDRKEKRMPVDFKKLAESLQKKNEARAWLREFKAQCERDEEAGLDREVLEQMFPDWDRAPGDDSRPQSAVGNIVVREPIEPTLAQQLAARELELQRAAHGTPIREKVEHVKSQGQTRAHGCHWPGCEKQVPPAMWGCKEHWYALPKQLRDKIWNAYRPGQEATLTPSREYLKVAHEVEAWIRRHLGETETRGPEGKGKFERTVRRAREREAVREKRWAVNYRGEQLFCAECHGKQFETPSGITCHKGHGGVESLTEQEVWNAIGEWPGDEEHRDDPGIG